MASASNSDFAAAVQTGLQALAENPASQTAQRQIQAQDYKSAWDEFGTSVSVDGAAPSAEIASQVVSDIAQSVEAAQNYDTQEANYLQAQQITPEQVQSAEQSVWVDLPPTEQMDANPSIDANPNVNVSPADVPTPESDASSTETGTVNEPMSTNEIPTPTEASTSESTDSSTATSTSLIAGLEIEEGVDNATPQAGATVNYTLLVSAMGPATSTEVMVTGLLPPGITFAGSTPSVGTYDSSMGMWDIGNMTPDSTANLVVTATLNVSDTLGQTISNTATVSESSDEMNPNQDAASSSASITVAASDTAIFHAIMESEKAISSTSETDSTVDVAPNVSPDAASNATPQAAPSPADSSTPSP